MKKFIMALVCLMTMVMSVNAQVNGWKIGTTEADELLGTTEDTYYLYMDGDKGGVIFYKSEPKKLYLIAPDDAMFNTRDLGFRDFGRSGNVVGVFITYGMYNNNDKLVKKDKNCVFEEIGREVANRIVSRKGTGMGMTMRNVGKELIEYMKNEKGYVRIVAPLFHTNRNFDIKVPCMNN